ncbi:MAG: hypothetical protein HQK60_01920 [Deltaproteobacteria bacterium]|nr:hypothetical protein [Deltaproteobacteria bacterium]
MSIQTTSASEQLWQDNVPEKRDSSSTETPSIINQIGSDLLLSHFGQPIGRIIPTTVETVTTIESSVVQPPPSPSRQDTFISLQKWEGTVSYIGEESFMACLFDLTAPGPDEEAEIPIKEISLDDRELLKPGAVFYWSIGYQDSKKGQRTRASKIRFRRLPAWRIEEIKGAEDDARKIGDLIGWTRESDSDDYLLGELRK